MSPRGFVGRLAVIALLTVGLVGMHHLVVTACHHGASKGAHSAAEVVSMGSVVDHGAHGLTGSAPIEAPSDGSDGAPGGLIGAAATCLAILLMMVGLVLPQVLARVRRWEAAHRSVIAPPMVPRIPEPPDLALLSVSRT